MKFSNYIISIILFAVILNSCADDNCNADTETLLKTEFIVNDTTLSNNNYIGNLSIYSSLWADSIHYNEEGSDNSLFFTLSPESDTSEIIITSSQAPLNDTIFIYSQRKVILLSPECGFVTNYIIDTVLHSYNYIDSLKIINKNISTDKDGSIKIYF